MARDIRGPVLYRAWCTYTYEDYNTKEIKESTVYFGPYKKESTARSVLTQARKNGWLAWQNRRSYGIDEMIPEWYTKHFDEEVFQD